VYEVTGRSLLLLQLENGDGRSGAG
jgi:hypothetical protein